MIESRVWGLPKEQAQNVLKTLTGVIVGYPSGWNAAYRFNIREAVLGARLVNRADQVAMVGDAIATLLSRLPSADGSPITLPDVFKQASLAAVFYFSSILIGHRQLCFELINQHDSKLIVLQPVHHQPSHQ